MNRTNATARPLERFGLALIGWLGGNFAVNLIFTFYMTVRAYLLHNQPGEFMVWQVIAAFALACATFSFAGWALIGLPFIFVFPNRILLRLNWPTLLLIGAALGPFAVLLSALLLTRGEIDPTFLPVTGILSGIAAVISVFAFGIYSALVRRASR